MNVKLLLDENLSPRVTETLCKDDGVDAIHVRDRGLLDADDHLVLEKAFDEDRILVTCNVDDFVKLARARELHPPVGPLAVAAVAQFTAEPNATILYRSHSGHIGWPAR